MKENTAVKNRNLKRVTIIILTIVIAAVGIGCSRTPKAPLISETSLYDFTDKISQENMLASIKVLASVDNARVAGFEGEQKAAQYIQAAFERYGLKTDKSAFSMDAFMCTQASLEVNIENQPLKDIKVVNFSNATPKEGISTDLISVGLGGVNAYSDKHVQGKIVLIQRGGEKFIDKAERAKGNGAVAVVFYDPMAEGNASMFANFGINSTIPGVCITKDQAMKLEAGMASGKKVQAKLIVDSKTELAKSQNIFGVYESANNPDKKKIVISAHYDGVDTPAANDNASGTATILEIARILSEEKIELPYDIQFIAFGSEEVGLVGSSDYTRTMGSIAADNTLAVINFDMVGVGDTINFCTANGQSSAPILPQLRALGERMGFKPVIQELENSDHASFAYYNVPAITYYVSEDLNYHTDLDTIERIQPEMMVKACNYGLTVCTEFKAVQ